MRKRIRVAINRKKSIFIFVIILMLLIVIPIIYFKYFNPKIRTSKIPSSSILTNENPKIQTNIPKVDIKPNISDKIDDYLRAYEDKGLFSGSVLVARKGEILVSKGYGMANYEQTVFNTPETKFHLGSVTKQFTAMAIMQLQEKGMLNVNDPISKYISDYPSGKIIKIHHLLTHTSGITDYMNDDDSFWNVSRLYHPINKIIERFKNKPLKFQPGAQYSYSNSGYVLLAYIIEKVTEKSYEEYLNQNIFKPLNMKNTGYDHLETLIKNRASGYSISSGKLVNAEFFDRSIGLGADGLYSTTLDLYLWDRALYTEKLVSKASLEKIFTPYPPALKYGYGWSINGSEVSHFGRMNGFYTYIGRNTSLDSTIIVLSNIEKTPLDVIVKDLGAMLLEKECKVPESLTTIRIYN